MNEIADHHRHDSVHSQGIPVYQYPLHSLADDALESVEEGTRYDKGHGVPPFHRSRLIGRFEDKTDP